MAGYPQKHPSLSVDLLQLLADQVENGV